VRWHLLGGGGNLSGLTRSLKGKPMKWLMVLELLVRLLEALRDMVALLL
jgi:hypothetical protein